MVKKKSLVVFHNGEVIAHITHNKAVEEYAIKHGIDLKKAFSKEHVLSMLVLVKHDIAEVIVYFGEVNRCKEILEELGITVL